MNFFNQLKNNYKKLDKAQLPAINKNRPSQSQSIENINRIDNMESNRISLNQNSLLINKSKILLKNNCHTQEKHSIQARKSFNRSIILLHR